MTASVYDARKAHEYYERTKKLKGRKPGAGAQAALNKVGGAKVKGSAGGSNKPASAKQRQAAARAKSVRLTKKLHSLNAALKEATEALRKQKQSAHKSKETAKKTAKKNSDGKTTAKEKQQSKEYRQKHKAEIAAKAKTEGKAGGTATAKKSVSSMSQTELTKRISTIKGLIASAKKQLKEANSLSHSQLDDEPHLIHDGTMAVDTK